jgi:hypothetical protein
VSPTEQAMADLCRAYKGLSQAAVLRDRPDLQAAILERVCRELRAVAGKLADEGERLAEIERGCIEIQNLKVIPGPKPKPDVLCLSYHTKE